MFIASAAIKIDLQKQERLHLLNLQHAKNVWLYGTVPFCSNIPRVHLIRALYNSFIGTGIFNLNLSVSYLYMHVGSH